MTYALRDSVHEGSALAPSDYGELRKFPRKRRRRRRGGGGRGKQRARRGALRNARNVLCPSLFSTDMI